MARYFGVPLRNGLPIGLGSVMAMGNPRGAPAPIPDPYFEYTTLLLPGNGTNGAQNNTFLDSSSNAFSITRNGNTTQGTFSPFSQTGWGNYFDGSGDYLTVPDNAAFDLGAGEFTLECFAYLNARASAYDTLIAQWNNSSDSWLLLLSGNTIQFYGNGALAKSESVTITTGQWYHFACTRDSSNNLRLYANGVKLGSDTAYSTTLINSTASPSIGCRGDGLATTNFNGYLSSVRVIKGSAEYTGSTYTVPTAPLTAITNTSLLTCQSNRFIDNSANAFAITRNGDVSVQAFSPFNPTASWSAATNGGSGYFDGSGDSLTFTDSSNVLDLGGATASVEFWVYAPNVSSGQGIFNKSGGANSWSTTDGYEYAFFISGGVLYFYYNNAGSAGTDVSATIVANQWTHVAVATNSSNAISLYINGSRVDTATNAITKPTTRTTMRIANTAANEYFSGYISGLRLISGSGAYDASQTTITVPTAPPTAVTNTQLLTNFTNAGIYDATSKNDLETVGNAQINTTQSKFGGSSMYFDGSGDKLTAPFFPWLQMGSGDWTIEMWLYLNATPGAGLYYGLYTNRASTANFSPIAVFVNSARKIEAYFSTSGSSWTSSLTTTSAMAATTWTHVAIVRSGSTVTVYFNGVADATTTTISGALFANTSPLWVGGENGGNDLNGYINDYRLTKGYARYTSNFTPPTTAFPLL